MPASQKKMGFSQLRVGVFILLGLAVFGFLILNSTGNFDPFGDRLLLKARFTNADGLRENAEVQLAGINIGKVTEIKFLPPNNASDKKIEAVLSVVTKLDGELISERIRTDSTARLVAKNILGNDKIINITPGTPNGLAVSSNHVLDSSAAISVNQLTQTGNDLMWQVNKLSVPINQILNKANRGEGTLGKIINDDSLHENLNLNFEEVRIFMAKVRKLIDKIEKGRGTAGKLLNDPTLYNNLNSTLSQLDKLSTDLRNGRGTVGKLLTDETIYNEAHEVIKDVGKSLKDMQPAIERLAQISSDVENIIKDLNAGKGTAGKLLKDEKLYQKLNSVAARIDNLFNNAQNGVGTLGKLITDETLYNNLNKTSSNINQLSSEGTKLVYDFRQNPKKFLTIKFTLF